MKIFNNTLLKECRKNKGLTQYDASKIIGVARTTYADYENGKIQPPIDKIHRICEWLDLPLDEIMQVENNTGVELYKFKTKKQMSDVEKIVTIKRIKRQVEILHTFDNMAETVKKMDIEAKEKALIINLLDYVASNYSLSTQDLQMYDRIARAENND